MRQILLETEIRYDYCSHTRIINVPNVFERLGVLTARSGFAYAVTPTTNEYCYYFWGMLFSYKNRKYVPIVDCDSLEHFNIAIKLLKTCGYRFAIISSSTNRFWIAIDEYLPFNSAMNLMESIPGNDLQFIDFCKSQRSIQVRVSPKNGSLPVVGDTSDIRIPEVRKFLDGLNEIFTSKEMKHILYVNNLVNDKNSILDPN